MIFIEILIVFLLGIILIILALPIGQGIADLIITVFEVFRSKMSLTISENNFKIQKMNEQLEFRSTQAIGFGIPSEEQYEEEEDENKAANKIGF